MSTEVLTPNDPSRVFVITVYPSESDPFPEYVRTTLDQLHRTWSARNTVPSDTPKHGNRVFVPGHVDGGHSSANVKSISLITCEVDNTTRRRIDGQWVTVAVAPEERVTVEYAVRVLRILGLDALVYTTFSHTADHHKFRILLAITRDLTPAEYERVLAYLHRRLNGRIDPATKDIGRPWFVPIRRDGRDYKIERVVGTPLDIDKFLAGLPAEASDRATPAEARRTNTRLGQWIDNLRAGIDVRELVERDGHDVAKRSSRYTAFFSPFRDDGRKPAFVVYVDHAYDFGTAEHFDAISYTRKAKNLDFWSALDVLAEYAGVAKLDRQTASRPAKVDPGRLIAALPDPLPTEGRFTVLSPVYDAIATQDEEDRPAFIASLRARTNIDKKTIEKGVQNADRAHKKATKSAAQRPLDGSAARYAVHEGRLSIVTGENLHDPLCSGDVRIVEVVHERVGDEVSDVFIIEATPIGGEPIRCEVPTADFEDMAWLAPMTLGRVYVETGRGARDALRHAVLTLSTPKTRTVYRDLGWHLVDGRHVFAHAGGVIGADDIEVRPTDTQLAIYDLTASNDRLRIAAGVRSTFYELAACAPAHVTGPLLGSAFHAPLAPALRARAALVFIGNTGTRKTTLAVEGSKFYGAFRDSRDCYSLETTVTAAEVVLHAAQNVPITLDDAWPKGTGRDAEVQKRLCRTLLHTYYNGHARRRATKDGNLRAPRPPRCTLWLTAETDIADPGDGESTSNRTIKLRFEKETVDLARLTECQKHGDDRRAMMAAFIRHLVDHPEWRTTLPDEYEKHLANARRMKGIADRHAEVIASLVAALHAFGQWSLQYLDESTVKPIIDGLARGIVDACREQTARTSEENPSACYLDLIRALLRLGRVKLLDTMDEKLSAGPCPDVGWRLTENGKTVIYFDKAALHAEAQRLARETNAPTPLPVSVLYPRLVEQGFALDDGSKGRNGVRMTLGESRVWFLAFPADVLDGLTEKERQANADAREASRPSVDDPVVEEITRRLANGGDLRIVPPHDPAAHREAV